MSTPEKPTINEQLTETLAGRNVTITTYARTWNGRVEGKYYDDDGSGLVILVDDMPDYDGPPISILVPWGAITGWIIREFGETPPWWQGSPCSGSS